MIEQSRMKRFLIRCAGILTGIVGAWPFWLAAEVGAPVAASESGAPLAMAEVGEPYFAGVPGAGEPAAPLGGGALPAGEPEFYDHGDPTELEQLMLERVNRARADPGAEAARLGIGLNDGLDPGTIADTPKPPLAMHRLLIDAARDHSQWMLDTDTFSHTGAGGSTVPQRIQAAGYVLTPSWSTGENIAWGGTTGTVDPVASTLARHDGLFISPGHRVNICAAGFDELGIGILLGVFSKDGTDWNALMATQKFALSAATPSPFLVGAVYYDFNDNGQYDAGEGIGGIGVAVEGASWFTETASAGGYALPMPGAAGTRTVTFDGPGLLHAADVAFAGGINEKVDLALAYAPPALSGPASPEAGAANTYTVSAVPGATAIHATAFRAVPAATDHCDDLSRVVDETAAGYSALSTTVRHEGTAAYHFAHPSGGPSEVLRYPEPFRVRAGAELRFHSRLGWATTAQQARVEVSTDGGNWTVVFEQAGTGGSGESAFTLRAVDLSAFAGESLWIRFHYRRSGSYYPQTSAGVGWYVDAVDFIALDALEEIGATTLASGEPFQFIPPAEGDYLLAAQPEHYARLWPAGPLLVVSASPPTGYAAWATVWEIAGGLAAGTLADHPAGDHSGDGVANAVACGLGLSPLASVAHLLPDWVADGVAPAYAYSVNTAATDIGVTVELSTDMAGWHPPGAPELDFVISDDLFTTDGPVEHRRLSFPAGPPARVFLRVRVE
jgi:hypothetical protein